MPRADGGIAPHSASKGSASRVTYTDRRDISPASVQALFRRNEWSDWWTRRDIAWYLERVLMVVSAWHGRRLVGVGMLVGDGRIDVHLSMLLVDAPYQRQGIGTELVRRMVDRATQLRPYSFQTDVFSEDAERLYARFGFRRNEGTWLLYHDPTHRRWAPDAQSQRRARRRRRRAQ